MYLLYGVAARTDDARAAYGRAGGLFLYCTVKYNVAASLFVGAPPVKISEHLFRSWLSCYIRSTTFTHPPIDHGMWCHSYGRLGPRTPVWV